MPECAARVGPAARPGARRAVSARAYLARDVKLRHLRLLVAIDDARQLSKVARILHITQPSVSKALAEVESSTGAPLFDRTPRGLLPTALGALIIRSARDVLAELERAAAAVEQLRLGRSSTLALGAMPGAALGLLAPALTLLRRREPGLALQVLEAPTDELLSRLAAGRLDVVLGARFRRALPEGLSVHPLYVDPLVIAAAPTHPVASAARVSWEELAASPWILTPPTNPLRLGFERALRERGLAPPVDVIDSSMMDLSLRVVAQGDALTLSPRRQALYLQGLGLWRIVADEYAQAIDLKLDVGLFTAAGAKAAGFGALLACLQQALADGAAA